MGDNCDSVMFEIIFSYLGFIISIVLHFVGGNEGFYSSIAAFKMNVPVILVF